MRAIQRSAASPVPGDSVPAPASISRSGSGQPLAQPIRNRVEPLLGADLGHVRVHSDAAAHDAAARLHARAFTYQNHIWLGRGQSAGDLQLMAHEATHTIQQGMSGIALRQAEDETTCAATSEAARTAADQVYEALDGWNNETRAIAALQGHGAGERDAIQSAFNCSHGQSLRSYLRDQLSEDWLVKSFALLHAAHTHDPQTQMGLALIPLGTRDEEVFRLLYETGVGGRRLLESGYNEYFGRAGNNGEFIGQGTLKDDLKDDLSGWREEKSLALLDRDLTDADELYFDSAGITGTHTDSVIERIQQVWARGPQAFMQMEQDWDSYVRNQNGWTEDTWYAGTLREAMDGELSGESWELVRSVLDGADRYRSGVGVAAGPLSEEQSRTLEDIRMEIAEATYAAATTGGFTGAGTNEEQVYHAVTELRAAYRARIERLRASGDEAGALEAERAWETRRTSLVAALPEEMDTDTPEYAHARLLTLGQLTAADEIWLASREFSAEPAVNLVTRTWATGGIDRFLEDARNPRLDGDLEVRPSFNPLFLVPVTSGTPWQRINALVREDRDDSARGAARLDIEFSEGTSDSDLQLVHGILTTPGLSPTLRSATIAQYVADYIGGDAEQSPESRFVAWVQERYEHSPTTYEIQDLLTPAATIEEMVERAEGRMESVHSGYLSRVLDDWMRDYDAITAEDTETTARESLERLRYIRDHQHDESGEIDAMLAITGAADATALARMEYGLFRERLNEVREIRRAIVEGVATAIQIAIEAAATALTGGAALPMLIASLSATVATMIARELLLGQNYELLSRDNARQLALAIASHGIGAAGRGLFAVSPERLAELSRAQAFLLNAAQDGFSAAGSQMVSAALENRMPSEADLAAGAISILGTSLAGGMRSSITHGLSERSGDIERLRTLVAGQVVQHVVSGNADEGAAMIREGRVGDLTGVDIAGRFLRSTGSGVARGVSFGIAEFHGTRPAPGEGRGEEPDEGRAAPDEEEIHDPRLTPGEEALLTVTRGADSDELAPTTLESELEVAQRLPRRPSADPDYDEEVLLPNGHIWRRRRGGGWCRFSNGGGCIIDRRRSEWRGVSDDQRGELNDMMRRGLTSSEDLEAIAFSRAQGDASWDETVALLRRLSPEDVARLAELLHQQDLPLLGADIERLNGMLDAGGPIRPLIEQIYNVRPALHAEIDRPEEDPGLRPATGEARRQGMIRAAAELGTQGGEEWCTARGIVLDEPLDPRSFSEPHGHGFDATGTDQALRRVVLEWKGESAELSEGSAATGRPPQMSDEWVGWKLAEMEALGVDVAPFLEAADEGKLVGYAIRTRTWQNGTTHTRALPGFDGVVYDPVRVRAAMAARSAGLRRPAGLPATEPDRTPEQIQQDLLNRPPR